MEVHIRNVPERSTENVLRKFLKTYLTALSILDVHVEKPQRFKFANLTFLSFDDAHKFLSYYGQVRTTGRGKPTPASRQAVNLRFLNQPIYCERSNREVNPYLLRVLRKEKIDREAKITDVKLRNDIPAKSGIILPIAFDYLSVSCGIWNYNLVGSDLVYAPQQTWHIGGTARFGDRAVILRMGSSHRIEFRYSSINDITTESGRSPSLIVSLTEPPRFFEEISEPVSELLANLNLNGAQPQGKRNSGPTRHRLSYLSESHKEIAGHCLVYKLNLATSHGALYRNDDINSEKIHLLRQAHAVPTMISRHTDVVTTTDTHGETFQRLHQTLASIANGIPFTLQFQIQKIAQNNYLPPSKVLQLLPVIIAIARRSPLFVSVNAVRKLANQIDFPGPRVDGQNFLLQTLIELLRENEEYYKRHGTSLDQIITEERSENVVNIHRVKVTPTSILLSGPEPESTNRVLRKYPENHDSFIRVTFCDEDGQPVRFGGRVSQDRIFNTRFKNILQQGITIGGRSFSFLGFSHSSLRSQTCWFMAPFAFQGQFLNDRTVIRDLGEFSNIFSPAKCAARIGQVFSDTPTTVKIAPEIVQLVDDVKRDGRVFSDGVGSMSNGVMEKIWDKLPNSRGVKPTCFQIRYSGAKGMIALDNTLQGDVLRLRGSMVKFEGTNKTDIEICEGAWKPLPLYLNRQFIKILEDMGTDANFFLSLQAKEVERLRMITASPSNASTFLKRQNIGDVVHLPWFISKLFSLNIDFRGDGFLRDVLEMALLHELRQLKHKTKIPVPNGRHLHGIMDESNLLKEDEIFCVFTEEGRTKVLIGQDVIISRAPCLHPGDVQVVEAIHPPPGSPLLKLRNCVVFSQKGRRDLPSKLSGGDLDGDRYYVIWDEAARPKVTYTPADYARKDPINIGRPVDRSDMTDFFIKFMETDQLGRIAVMHRILADQKSEGTLDPDCITLAEMHSTAVDFSKTGIPVNMSELPRYTPWRPDFEAPGPHVTIESRSGIYFELTPEQDADHADDDDDFVKYRYYESDKVLGRLYRSIDERAIFAEIQERSRTYTTNDMYRPEIIHRVWYYVQQKCRLIQWGHQKLWARDVMENYEDCVQDSMKEYTEHPSRPLTELEVFVGNVLGKTGAQSKRQRELSTSLKEHFDDNAAWIVNCILKNDDGTPSDEALERSMACLEVSLEEPEQRRGWKGREQLISFKYVAAAICLKEVERIFPGT